MSTGLCLLIGYLSYCIGFLSTVFLSYVNDFIAFTKTFYHTSIISSLSQHQCIQFLVYLAISCSYNRLLHSVYCFGLCVPTC